MRGVALTYELNTHAELSEQAVKKSILSIDTVLINLGLAPLVDNQTFRISNDVVTMDAMFKGLWDSMHVALLTGDKATALTFLTARAREVFDPVFEALLPHMTEVVASFTAFQGVKIREGYAEYALNRTLNGENHLFLIYFLKDADGVWRLEAM
jgi:hypothetical protein